jgi:hypothetical protein
MTCLRIACLRSRLPFSGDVELCRARSFQWLLIFDPLAMWFPRSADRMS